jgi:hypothetical protein
MAKPPKGKAKQEDDPIPDEVNEAIRRALRTPPKPQSDVLKERQRKTKQVSRKGRK